MLMCVLQGRAVVQETPVCVCVDVCVAGRSSCVVHRRLSNSCWRQRAAWLPWRSPVCKVHILFQSALGCAHLQQEAALRQSPPAFSVLGWYTRPGQ